MTPGVTGGHGDPWSVTRVPTAVPDDSVGRPGVETLAESVERLQPALVCTTAVGTRTGLRVSQ